MSYTQELLQVAAKVVWFEPPEKILQNPIFFLCYLMAFGSLEDVLLTRKYFSEKAFSEALASAPPGVFDARSWAYWNAACGNIPIPPMKTRF